MKARAQALPTPPDRHPYYRLECPALSSPLVFRRAPCVAQLGAVRWFELHRGRLVEVLGRLETHTCPVEELQELVLASAALVGACWADPVFELETPLDPESPVNAVAVLGELWEAGLDELELAYLAFTLAMAWFGTRIAVARVQSLVNFMVPPSDASNTSASGSPGRGDTTETGGGVSTPISNTSCSPSSV